MGYQGEGGRAAYCFASIVALNEVFGFGFAPLRYPLRLPCIKLVRALI